MALKLNEALLIKNLVDMRQIILNQAALKQGLCFLILKKDLLSIKCLTVGVCAFLECYNCITLLIEYAYIMLPLENLCATCNLPFNFSIEVYVNHQQ